MSAAHVGFFASPGLMERLQTVAEIPPRELLISSYAILFPDADRASGALAFLRDDLPRDDPDLEPIAATGLGDESFGFSGSIQDLPPPGFVMAWRVENAVMLVAISAGEDAMDASGALALAEKVDARAG